METRRPEGRRRAEGPGSGAGDVLLSLDISGVLADWDFHPDDLQVRLITGDDGRDKIQMRVDLGVLQIARAFELIRNAQRPWPTPPAA